MKSIIVKPIITEKMTSNSEKFNRFGFVVDAKANKIEIKNAIEKMYSVTVEAIRTMNYLGKVKTRNTKSGLAIGRVNKHKKAIVSLKKGETIDFYSNI
ncbi:MAG: 50S ribosomal protein L23 [Bacteroidetes bacterium]|nr:50S ribosomal protein L23 [Bacteroidota bacterium]